MSKKKKKIIKDPFAAREAKKYKNPIPSREFIIAQLESKGIPMRWKKIAALLNIQDEEQLEGVRRRLKAMERDGQLMRTRRGDYGLPKKMDMVRGRIMGHPDGFGFLIPEAGGDDLFLSERQMHSVFHGDKALAQVVGKDRRGRREGAIVEVLERGTETLAGRFVKEKGVAYVIPSNRRIAQDILIPDDAQKQAKPDQMVIIKLIKQPEKRQPPVGEIIKVLGRHMAPGMETDIAIHDHNIPVNWSEAVEKVAKKLPRTVPTRAKKNREDLRETPLMTIDGEDSRDFDDAVFCEPYGKGWRLLVAIADVSHYVKPGSALDQGAYERGTSVYFPNRVVPMLPEALSNGLCSLNPNVDRLCLVCEMFVTRYGGVRRYRFTQAVMRSAARLTYTQVGAALDGDENAVASHILPHLKNLHNLYLCLRERREKRGALDLETTETRIIFGEGKKIENIVPVVRNDAHKLIEEMMLLANVTTANFLASEEMPFLYRVHARPEQEKLEQLRSFLKPLGLVLYGKEAPNAKHYAKLLQNIQERPDKQMIQTVLLRSLKMAIYTPENVGHFGLAYDAYTHFTSPIRRYPDLLTHRAIVHRLHNKQPEEFDHSPTEMAQLGEHCSMTERRADEATRDVTAWLKCEYLQDRVGETAQGRITAVTSFGVFVELEEIFVEGLVHISTLKSDYYHFDAANHLLRGERGGKVYRLYDPISVKVTRVDLDERKIDFVEV
ncbi:ribonuclease R [Candidatus Venteria ishoeyi]|uniref:Ribonuclease R n=1 Tax=Candidatus Venteria ishoeyi TaxID=1899563 RepID=A0A1H6F637_9GAMM|nr:ribonuclease R [Candidatus Venteria ishoeyi]MDM8547576.1 ribonuclease R [Candidatus Venteria ishoeyi]SEH04536.1 Ribonuclease R [Candidatus Venteria ishoeyi]